MKQQSLFALKMKQQKEHQQQQPQIPNNIGMPPVFKIESIRKDQKAKYHGIPVKEYSEIEDQNIKAIQEMDEAQILSMQQELQSLLGDKLVKLFKSGDLYRNKDEQTLNSEIDQQIVNNQDSFKQFLNDDQLLIQQIQVLTNKTDLSSTKIALSMIESAIKVDNLCQLEQIRITEYLLCVLQSSNITIALSGFDILYKYWNTMVPDCWNIIYSNTIGDQDKQNDKQKDKEDELQTQNIQKSLNPLLQQRFISESQYYDICRINSIITKHMTTYTIPHTVNNIQDIESKLKYIILTNNLTDIQTLDINQSLDQFILERLYEYYQLLSDSQINILMTKLDQLQQSLVGQALLGEYKKKYLVNLQLVDIPNPICTINPFYNIEMESLMIIPVESKLINHYNTLKYKLSIGTDIQDDLRQMLVYILTIKYRTKLIISKLLRSKVKWSIITVIRNCYKGIIKEQLMYRQSAINTRGDRFLMIDIINQQLEIISQVGDKQIRFDGPDYFQGLQGFLRQSGYDSKQVSAFTHQYINTTDFDWVQPDWLFLKLIKLLLSTNQLPDNINQFYLKLLRSMNWKTIIQLMNKNVSYFEKLLQKCIYDSFYQEIYVNIIFLFIHPGFKRDFHNLLLTEFTSSPILQNLNTTIYTEFMKQLTAKPQLMEQQSLYQNGISQITMDGPFFDEWRQLINEW